MGGFRLPVDELLRCLSRPSVYIAAVLLAALTTGGIVRSSADLEAKRSQYDEQLQERTQARLRTINPSGRVVDPGFRVLRSPNPRTILVKGNVAVVPSAWDFGPAGAVARLPYLSYGTGTAAAGIMDFESIVLVFGGLICLALGLERVITDRDSGWTAALKALPVPWRISVAARLAGGTALVTLLVALWLAIVVVMLVLIEPEATSDLPWTLALLTVPTWLYLVAFHMLGVAIAQRIPSSTRAVTIGMTTWLVATLVFPQGLALIDRALDAGATRQAMERERQEAFADEFHRLEDEIGRSIAANVPDGPLLRGLSTIDEPILKSLELDAFWVAGAEGARAVADKFELQWLEVQLRRQEVQDRNIAISPASALTTALAELAGSGWDTHRAWERAAIQYHSVLAEALFDNRPVVNTRVTVGGSTPSFALDRSEWKPYADLPGFEEPVLGSRNRWDAARPAVVWLLLHFLVMLFLAYRGGIRELARLT